MRSGRRLPPRAGTSAQLISYGQVAELTDIARASRPAVAERRLAAILRFLPVAVFALDSGGFVTSVSEAGVDIFEASSAEVVGRSIFELIAAPRIGRQIRRALTGHQVTGVHRSRGGRYFRTRLAPVLEHDGRVSGIIGVSVDVTGAWLDKHELRQLRQQHRRRIEHGRLLDRVMRARQRQGRSEAEDRYDDPIQELLRASARA